MRTLRLGDVLDIQNGFAFDSDLFSENEGMPLIRIRDLKEGTFTDTKYKGKFDESFRVRRGDYLIGMDGEFRCYKWKGEDALLNQRVCRLINFDKTVFPEYIFYGINLHLAKIERNTAFVTVKHISSKQIKEIKFPFPPLEDQIRIANILSKAEALISQRKESLRLLDELLKSTFLEMFGRVKGVRESLSNFCEINPKKSEITNLSKDTLVSFIPMAAVSEKGEVDLSQSRILSKVWTGFTYFKENDVVFAKITPCMENGKGGIMKNLKNGFGFGTTEFHVLRPIKNISTPEWLYHLTMQENFRNEAAKNMTGSAGQKRVPTDFFSKYQVALPPFKLQTQFAHIVEKTEALKAHYQTSLEELENLYGSLSQRAFKGELSLNDN